MSARGSSSFESPSEKLQRLLESKDAEIARLRAALEGVAERAAKAESVDNKWAYDFRRFGAEIARDIRAAIKEGA